MAESNDTINEGPWIDPSAIVDGADIGAGTRVWGLVHVREAATIGRNCVVGRGAYIDHGVKIGDGCKIQNGAMVFAPAVLAEGVFIGPGALITNDRMPRAVDENLEVKRASDWEAEGVRIERGASVGANATVVAGVVMGAWSMLAAGAVAVSDVPAHALAVGVPARRLGWIGRTGTRLVQAGDQLWMDPHTGRHYREAEGGIAEVTT